MLTKARIRAVGRCRAVGDEDRRRVAAAFGDGVEAGVLWAPGLHGKLRGVPAMKPRGQ